MEEDKAIELKRLINLVITKLKQVQFLSGYRILETRERGGFLNNLMIHETSNELEMERIRLMVFINSLEEFILDSSNEETVKSNLKAVNEVRNQVRARGFSL